MLRPRLNQRIWLRLSSVFESHRISFLKIFLVVFVVFFFFFFFFLFFVVVVVFLLLCFFVVVFFCFFFFFFFWGGGCLMRGERIQIPLNAGHARPASDTPLKYN